jgi:quinol monooxygenase YgiN
LGDTLGARCFIARENPGSQIASSILCKVTAAAKTKPRDAKSMGCSKILVIGTFRLPAEKLDAARPAMRAMIAASRAEEECLEYGYAEDVLEPGLIHVKEIWRSRAGLEAHLEAPHLRIWRASWAELGIGDRLLGLCEIGAPESI